MRNKTVTVALGDELYVKGPHLFQYDYGLELVIDGVQLPQNYEVHFSNTKHGVAKKATASANGVLIPDEYLRSGEDVYAWVYLRNGDTDGYTVYSVQFPVIARSVEQGDNISVIEHNIIDKALSDLAEAVEKTGEDVERTNANVSHYPIIDDNNHWMVYDAIVGDYVDTGIVAIGEDGYSPTITVEDTPDGRTIVITDKDNMYFLEVLDGDYHNLYNKPTLNNVELDGEMSLEELGIASIEDIPTAASDLINDVGYLTNFTETDPTVPSWAKQQNKPSYTPQEVGALPEDTFIPSNISDLVNDSGYLTTETDPTVPSWAKSPAKPTYTPQEVGALPDDTFIPEKVSDLQNDSGYLTTETDPTVPSWAKAQTKPSYTAQEVGAIDVSMKGAVNGVAELDANGKVPTQQLPSYVDDVMEYDSSSLFPLTGETGKIYVAKDTNKTYRWSGSAYIEISPSLTLGETSSTAYRGDRGKIAYDHAASSGSAYASGLYKITTNSVGHVISASQVEKSDITSLGIPGSVPTKVSDLTDDSGHYTKPASGIPASDIEDGVIPDITGKADKVSSPTNGNFAGLDSNGNLTDSGHKHSDYITDVQVDGTSVANNGVASIPEIINVEVVRLA